MTNQTWFVDVDMTLQTPVSDALVDDLQDVINKLYGALAVGPGPSLGLALAVEAADIWEAGQIIRAFLADEIVPLTGQSVFSSVRVLDQRTRTAENEAPTFPPLVAVPDIAEMLSVTRQQAGRLTHKTGFPRPALETRLGNLWTRAAVEAWNERTERTVGRPRAADEGKKPLEGSVIVGLIHDAPAHLEELDSLGSR